MTVAFGRLCAHFAAVNVSIVALLAMWLLSPWVVYALLALLIGVNGIFALAAYLELNRIEEVKGKSMREAP